MSKRRGALPKDGVPAGETDQPTGNDDLMQTGFVRPGLADVIAKRDAEFTDDTGITPEDPENIDEHPAPPEPDAPKAAEPEPTTAAPPTPAPPSPAAADAEEEELIVDGEKVKKTKAELLEIGRKAAQKVLAADKRLEEASRMRREAEEALTQSRAAAPRTPPPEPEAPPPAPDLDKQLDDARKALIQANAYGDTEEQEKAHRDYEAAVFAKANQGRQLATPLDLDALAEKIETTLTQNQQKKVWGSIVSKFKEPAEAGGFADVNASPHWSQIAATEVNRLVEEHGMDVNDWETYRLAGERVRSWMTASSDGRTLPTPPVPPKGPAKSATVDPTLAHRADRKRQVPQVPTASAAATVPEEPKDTPTDIVSGMARARPGQRL